MKRMRIVQAVLLVATAALAISCSSGRETSYDPYPPRRANFSLIIHAAPGMAIHRYHDGRYYYRDRHGYRYWRGYDNRYYLDRTYINKVRYDRGQYKAWKNGHRRYYRRSHRY